MLVACLSLSNYAADSSGIISAPKWNTHDGYLIY